MRTAILTLLIVAVPALSQAPTPNSLTPQQARDGWILLYDGESTVGWEGKGAITAREGEMVLNKRGGLIWWGVYAPPPNFTLVAEARGSITFFEGVRRSPKDRGVDISR